jgi:protein TonB
MTASRRYANPPRISRNVVIAGGVLAFHAAVLWAIQSGLVQRVVEVVTPVVMISEIITPPEPKAPPPPPSPPPPAPKPPAPAPKPKAPTPPPAPRPVAIPDPTPAPSAPVGVTAPQPPAPPVAAPVAAPEAPPPAPPAPPAPAKIELPSTDADYLDSTRLNYPPISRRLGEQGKVLVRVTIGPDGSAQRAEIAKSSGFERLDKAALEYVLKRRYVPGKVNGVPQSMAYTAPVNFILE